MKLINDIRIVILLCLTLGLAPFFPEPHVWGKLKWILGDPTGMKPMDYIDLLLHGLPFLLLIRIVFLKSSNYLKRKQ